MTLHREVTTTIGHAYPGMAASGLGCPYVYIGEVWNGGGSFAIDPFWMYAHKEETKFTGPNMLVFGKVGVGKSAFVKTYALRQLLHGRRVWVLAPRAEYERLAAVAMESGYTTAFVALAPSGGVKLNPLDPSVPLDGQRTLLEAIAETALTTPDGKPRRLDPPEQNILHGALTEAHVAAAAEGRAAVLSDVVEAMLSPSPGLVAWMRAPGGATEVFQMGYTVALAFRSLIGRFSGAGEEATGLGSMFDGPTTPGIDLSAQLVVLDLSAVEQSSADADQGLAVAMACVSTYLQGVLNRRGGENLIVVLDEAWRFMRLPATAKWLSASFKMVRQYGAQFVAVFHRLSDLRAVGKAGEATVEHAEGLVADAGIIVVYGQAEAEKGTAAEIIGLTSTEVAIVADLEPGSALWLVGGRHFVVRHVVDWEVEGEVVDTDAPMLGRTG